MKLTDMYLDQLEREAPITRRVVERVPDGINDWKPHEKSMELGRLAGTVASMFSWFGLIIGTEYLDLSAGGGGVQAATTEERLALFDKSLADARRAFASTSDEHLMKPWQLRVGEQVVDDKPRYMQITDTFCHLAHHRGQLSVYLRLRDVAIPSIYGPTADEGWGQ